MQVVVRVETGGKNRQAVIRAGQVLRVGRTEWADFCVPHDEQLADVHFSIACDASGCRVADLGTGQFTLLNDQEIDEAVAFHGDRITAGQTVFSLTMRDDSGQEMRNVAASASDEVAAGGDSGYEHVAASTAAEICELVDFDPAVLALAGEGANPKAFLAALVENDLYADAVRLLAYALPKRESVFWAVRCVEDVLVEQQAADVAALSAARAWVREDNEENRRAAGEAAAATQLNTAAGMTAQSAFWSGGSIAPADVPDVPPGEVMTARGVASTVLMAAFEDATKDPQDLLRQFVQYGTQVADGQLRWEEASTA